jgi:aspartyl-tRNA(Asn)/glutamyl-tRNA(Gln) amidotransferase subunit A
MSGAPAEGELVYLGIAELGTRLRRRALSPVELCQVLLARCTRLDPSLNAFITLEPERVLAQARVAEAELQAGQGRGPLHGVPVAVKDLCWTRGERTTAGSRLFADFVPDQDATVVARLRAAGAIVFGKTNTPELAYGPLNAYRFGPSRNPWDLERFTGGSSMGAAAALAGGLAPGALGSDTGGSIRGPANWSGVVGLKPTYGRVPLRGVIPLAASLDHVGPMARSALDCALLLGVIAGHDPDDPTSAAQPVPDYAAGLEAPLRGLRVGVPWLYPWDTLAPDIGRVLEAALGALGRLGLTLAPATIPGWHDAVQGMEVLIRCEAAAEYAEVLATRAGDLLPEVRERLIGGRGTAAPTYIAARRAGARLRRALDALLGEVDLVALPCREHSAPRIDAGGRHLDPLSTRNYFSPLNVAGLPALAVPCGFDDRGLPVALQLVGRAWAEGTLLAVAHAYQQATDWHTRRPPLDP